MEVHCHHAQPKPYRPRRPAQTVLYQVVQGHLETALAAQGDGASAISAYAERALWRYLECGILAHGFARARCSDCGHDCLIAFSCKGLLADPSEREHARHRRAFGTSALKQSYRETGLQEWLSQSTQRLQERRLRPRFGVAPVDAMV